MIVQVTERNIIEGLMYLVSLKKTVNLKLGQEEEKSKSSIEL